MTTTDSPSTAPTEVFHPELVSEAFAIVPARSKRDAADLLVLAERAARDARAIVIADDLTFAQAAEALGSIKGVSKRLESVRSTMKAPVLESGRAIDAFFKAPAKVLDDAERALKSGIADYQAAAEKRRREAEAKERADRARIEAEQRAAEAAAAAERAKMAPAEREAAEIDDMFGPANPIPATVAAPAAAPVVVPQAKGVSTRTVTKARVVDVEAIVAAAAKGDRNAMSLLVVDQSALNGLVKVLGAKLAIPGVETFEDVVVSARAS